MALHFFPDALTSKTFGRKNFSDIFLSENFTVRNLALTKCFSFCYLTTKYAIDLEDHNKLKNTKNIEKLPKPFDCKL